MTHIVWWGWDHDPNTSMEIYGITMYKKFFPEGKDFTYHYDIRTLPPGTGAILVISACISEQTAHAMGIVPPVHYGGDRSQTLASLQEYIRRMPWVIILVAQDEDAHVPFETLVHPNMRIWVQVPKPPVTPGFPGLIHAAKCGPEVRRLPVGWDGMFDSLDSPEFQPSFESRPIDWLFKGQCVYHRHGEWLTALQNLANHPEPLPINEHCDNAPNWTFLKYEGQDALCREDGVISVQDYIKLHTSAKVVICRPENWNPCPARVFFVLQAGCVPIVSERPSLLNGAWNKLCDWNGWWEYMLGEKPPFPVVKDVNDLGRILQETVDGWPENGKHVYSWWQDYKERLKVSLLAEIQAIQK